jgi:outer membrane biosynthesis protein TonB
MEGTYKDDGSRKKDKISAAIGTALFYMALLLVFIFFGFKTKLPLPEESGIEVMLGEVEFGSPGAYQPEPSQPRPQEASEPQATESEPESSESEVATEAESDVVLPEKKEEKKTEPQKESPKENTTEKKETEKKEEKEEPKKTVNQNLLYTGGKNDSKGTGTKTGNQGDPNGSPTSTNPGHGSIGGNGKWDLKGRGLVKPPPPIDDKSQKVERVVIEITVNKQGVVIGAKATIKGGGTITTGPLVEKAIASAKQARFTPDPNGSEEQYGTITFDFKLR